MKESQDHQTSGRALSGCFLILGQSSPENRRMVQVLS
jgi:hypothetical protein